MKPNSDAFASPAPAAEFDREIQDMAYYIHNYKVDSELAVCCHPDVDITSTG